MGRFMGTGCRVGVRNLSDGEPRHNFQARKNEPLIAHLRSQNNSCSLDREQGVGRLPKQQASVLDLMPMP